MKRKSFEINNPGEIKSAVSSIRVASAPTESTIYEVGEIIRGVREEGDHALLEYTRQFDGVKLDPDNLEVPETEKTRAWEDLDAEVRRALEKAKSRISSFAAKTLSGDWRVEIDEGLTVGEVARPLDAVGIYIPGGRYSYPSTVLMTGVPALEAGVGRIEFCVPPAKDGTLKQVTLAATSLIEGSRVFRAGGAQAIAAMAYGTESVPACRMIAGPGNVYVTMAKRLVANDVSIDLEAGPSELAVYFDSGCDLSFPAADVLAQLEHDPMSIAVLVSESPELLEAAMGTLSGLADGAGLKVVEGIINLVACSSREVSLDFINELAPEHLEVMVEDCEDLLEGITSAGTVFLGPYSAAAMGDYIAGPSHVLPTGGTARRLSGLRAESFRRRMNVIAYTEGGFRNDAADARLLASIEKLQRHALSIDIRTR